MRKLATLTALTLSLMGSAAAVADAPYQGPMNPQFNHQPQGPATLPPPNAGGPRPAPQGGYHDEWNQGGPRGGDQFDIRHGDLRDRGFGGGRGFDDHRFDGDRRFDRNFDFSLHFGNFDRWERGWGYGNYRDQYRRHQQLSQWRLVRALEAQGFYGVRGLRPAQWGFGLRAFAFNYRGQPVMLRINPYTGRVMDVRYLQPRGYGYRY